MRPLLDRRGTRKNRGRSISRPSRLVSAAALTVLVVACGSDPTGSPTTNWPTVEVAVSDNEFTPANISVHVGQSVHWAYGGRNKHDLVVADGPDGFGISLDNFSAANGAYTFTFVKKGTFVYYCSIHGTKRGRGMAGTVTVTK